MIPRSPITWMRRILKLDLKAKRAIVDLEAGHAINCTVARSADWNPNDVSSLGAPRVGLSLPGQEHFVDLDCGAGRKRYVERIDVLSESSLAIVGDDKYLLILKRSAKSESHRLLKSAEPCGDPSDRCPKGQVCTATHEDSPPSVLETCRKIE